MPKFSLERIIDIDIEKIFDLVTDIENLPKILPHRFPSVRLLSTRNDTSVIEMHFVIDKREIVMMTRHVIKPYTHQMFVIGGDAKGSCVTERYFTTNNGTRITIDVNLKLGGVTELLNHKIRDDYIKFVDEIVNFYP